MENDQPKASSVWRLRSPEAAPRGARRCGHQGWVKGLPSGCFLRSELTGSFKPESSVAAHEGVGTPRGDGHLQGGCTRPSRPFLGSRGLCPLPHGRPRHTQLPCAAALMLGTDGTAAQGLDPQSKHCSWLTRESLNH